MGKQQSRLRLCQFLSLVRVAKIQNHFVNRATSRVSSRMNSISLLLVVGLNVLLHYFEILFRPSIIKIFTHHSDSRCQPASSGSDGASGNKRVNDIVCISALV